MSQEQLLQPYQSKTEEGDGILNPGVTAEVDHFNIATLSGESEHEAGEIENAKYLVKDLKKKRKKKQRELTEELVTPKEDVARELRIAKKRGKKRLDDSLKQEKRAEDIVDMGVTKADKDVPTESVSMSYRDDGTVPMEDSDTADSAVLGKVKQSAPSSKHKKSRQPPTVTDSMDSDATPGTTTPDTYADSEGTPTKRNLKRSSRIDRLRAIREKAKLAGENEAKKEESISVPQTRQRKILEKPAVEYDDEEVLAKEKSTDEKSSRLKQRLKRLIEPSAIKTLEAQISADEAYKFFTHVWPAEPEVETACDEEQVIPVQPEEESGTVHPSTSQHEDISKEVTDKTVDTEVGGEETVEQEVAAIEEIQGDERPLLDTFLAGDSLTVRQKAQYIPSSELREKEQNILFQPSAAYIPPREKMFDDNKEPRYLAEEGFYVGVLPKMQARNVNRMEHRLLSQPDKGKQWFGEDGRIKFLPDPLLDSPTRPAVTEKLDPSLQTVYQKARVNEVDNRYIAGVTETTAEYQIDIDINSVTFTHHHLFSHEHVLATQLTLLYEQHLQRKRRNMVDFLTEKLRALKRSLIHLRELLATEKRSLSKEDRANYKQRLDNYMVDFKHYRQLRDLEETEDRTLVKSLIATWRDLKSIRSTQNYNSTSHKLQLRRLNTNKARDEELWQQDLQDEVDEIMQEERQNYKEQESKYNELLQAYEEQKAQKKAASKRQKKRVRLHRKQEAEATADTEAVEDPDTEEAIRDQNILDEEPLCSPELPHLPDETAIKAQVNNKMKQARRLPGEPKLDPYLTQNTTITQTSMCHRDEQLRRDAISKYKAYIRILFNGKEVSRTDAKTMNQDFTMNFGQIYNLKIVHWPSSIKFELYEVSSFSRTLISTIFASIPEPTVLSNMIPLEGLEFSSDQQVSHNNTAVGSGISWSVSTGSTHVYSLMTSGKLWCSVGWATSEDGTPLVPPIPPKSHTLYSNLTRIDPVAGLGVSGMVDIDKLSEWISKSRLDPNDPANADIAYLFNSKDSGISLSKMADYFRLEKLQEEFNFTTDEYLSKLRRFQMIELRDQEVTEFKNFKQIPSLEREISRDIFIEYEKRIRDEERLKRGDVSTHRAAVAQFIQKVKEQMLKRHRISSHQKRLEEVIIEEAVPNIAILTINFMKLLKPRRPLRPERKERKKFVATAIRAEDIHLLVSITRVFDVPVRRQVTYAGGVLPSTHASTEMEQKNLKSADSLVNPFVEVTFQRNTLSTSVGEGPNPSFNEELRLPFKAVNDDYSPTNLQNMKDKIYINLFDQVAVDILEDDRLKDTNIHQRLEKKWLGNIEIPFTTVYNNGKVDGTFRVTSPPVLLGYTHNVKQSTQPELEVDLGLGQKTSTYLSMFLTVEPPLVLAEQIKDRFATNENEQLLDYAERWAADLEAQFPRRRFLTNVIDVSGKTVFVTRYFRPLNPPDEACDSDEKMARFVSLIPFSSDSTLLPGICDIWARSDEFLSMLSGDEEEHAILLTNYFLAQNKQAWLITGSAIPEGPTAYVLTTDDNHMKVIWNASTGRKYRIDDAYCPLQNVWCLINGANIWANTQHSDQPYRMEFDVSVKSHWRPLFTGKIVNPGLMSIQPENLAYVPTDMNYIKELQEKIEQTLRNKITEWRMKTSRTTPWNRYCVQSLRNLLPRLEATRGELIADQHVAELEPFLASYRMSGFPMNFAYHDITSIIEAIYSTGVHSHESNDVEFALAVFVHPYPNSVLSIWIYLASLIRIR